MPSKRLHTVVPWLAGLCLALPLGCHPDGVLRREPLSWPVQDLAATDPDASRSVEPKQADAPPVEARKLGVVGPLGKSTVLAPDLPQRPISRAECIALALENGRTGAFFDGPGSTQRTSVTGITETKTPSTVTDNIRVFAYDPAIVATNIDESLARFDIWGETGLFWNRIDQRSRFLTPLTPFDQVSNRDKADDVDFSTGLYRRLPAGGFAGLRFRTDYESNALTSNGSQVINPIFRPIVDVTYEQPLLQGAGRFINQLRDFHPSSIRQTFPDAGKPPGILLARISHRQQQLEFERQVHELIYWVEEAYWQLYSAYWDFYSSDNGMKQAHAAWQVAKARFDAGGLSIEDLAMIEEQYHFFRNQRLQSLGRGQPGRPGVLEAERRLRYVIGLPTDDGTRLTPLDAPDFVAYDPDVNEAVLEAQALRPELKQVEQEIVAAELLIDKARDRMRPDLRFVSRYGLNGLGDDLGEGLADLGNNPHHEWEVGLRLQAPLGFRAGYAETARARLQLTQRLVLLRDEREKLLFSLQRSHQELIQYREQYQVRIRQREAAALQLKARSEKFKAGGDPKQPGSFIDLLLRAQRNWADALREEYLALCSYRIAITDFERQRGTILRYANVAITEGAVSDCVHANASEYLRHTRQQAPAAKLGDQAVPVVVAGTFPVPGRATSPAPAVAPAPAPHASLGLPMSGDDP